jgi:hypothetical protein
MQKTILNPKMKINTVKTIRTAKTTVLTTLALMLCFSASAQTYDSLWAARDRSIESKDAKTIEAAYEWSKARLESTPREFNDLNLLWDLAQAANRVDDFKKFCALKSDDANPETASSAAIRLATIFHDDKDPKNAEVYYRKVIALGDTCPSGRFHDASSRLAHYKSDAGDKEGAIALLLPVVIKHPSTPPSWAAQRIMELSPPQKTITECVEAMKAAMAKPYNDAGGFISRAERLLPGTVDFLLALGRGEEALQECKAMLFLANEGFYQRAVEITAKALKQADGNLGRANEFLMFQSEESGNAPPLMANPLFIKKTRGASESGNKPDPVREKAYAEMSASPAPSEWNQWLARSAWLLWLDRPAEATDAALEAFKSCPLEERHLQTCAAAVVRPYLVVTRDYATARVALDFMLYGAAGKDGAAGTADDIKDPFPAIKTKLTY